MSAQIIEKDGLPEWAVLPYEEYQRLLSAADMLEDIQAYDAASHALKTGEEELIPSYVANKLFDGDNPILVWRKFRGLTQANLANAVGISSAYLSQIESGKRSGTAEILNKIAQQLNISIDDLI